MTNYSIAISSGGMKGMFTLGALHGLNPVRDQVEQMACASSGVLNAAYFLAGQTEQAREVYQHLASSDFIKMRNLPPRMRIEYAWSLVFENERFKLDLEKVINAPTELIMPLLNVDTGNEELFTNRATPEQLTEVLKASIAVPVWYGGVVKIGKYDYIDGAVTNPFPLHLLNNIESRIIGISTKQRPFMYAPNKTMISAYAQYQYNADPEESNVIQLKKSANVARARIVAAQRDATLITPKKAFHQLTNDGSILENAFKDGVELAGAVIS